MAKSDASTPTGSSGAAGPGRRRLRNTVRAANLAMLACISDDYQQLANEALAVVIRRQSQAGRPQVATQQLLTVAATADDTQDLFARSTPMHPTSSPSTPTPEADWSYPGRRLDDEAQEEAAA
jgi:hypothetical protein